MLTDGAVGDERDICNSVQSFMDSVPREYTPNTNTQSTTEETIDQAEERYLAALEADSPRAIQESEAHWRSLRAAQKAGGRGSCLDGVFCPAEAAEKPESAQPVPQSRQKPGMFAMQPRIMTVGIGPYTNAYFLKMLAQV